MKSTPVEGDTCRLQITVESLASLAHKIPEAYLSEFPKTLDFKVGDAHNQLFFLIERNLYAIHERESFTVKIPPNWLVLCTPPGDDFGSASVSRNEADVYRNDSVREPLLNGTFPRPQELVLDKELEKCTPVTSCFPCVLNPVRPSTPEYEPTPVEAELPPIVQIEEAHASAQCASASNLSGSSLHSSDASLCSNGRETKGDEVCPPMEIQDSVKLTVELDAIVCQSSPIYDLNLDDRLQRAVHLKSLGSLTFKQGLNDLAFDKYSRAVKYCIFAVHLTETSEHDEAVRSRIQKLQSQCHLNMALTQKIAGNHNGVIQNCSKALELDPSNAKALFRRGKAYLATSQLTEAENDLSKALTLEPKNSAIIRELKAVKQNLKTSNSQISSGLSKMFMKK